MITPAAQNNLSGQHRTAWRSSAALGIILDSDGKPADHASIENPALGGNPGGFLGYATAWLEYRLRGNVIAAGAFTGTHPELVSNTN